MKESYKTGILVLNRLSKKPNYKDVTTVLKQQYKNIHMYDDLPIDEAMIKIACDGFVEAFKHRLPEFIKFYESKFGEAADYYEEHFDEDEPYDEYAYLDKEMLKILDPIMFCAIDNNHVEFIRFLITSQNLMDGYQGKPRSTGGAKYRRIYRDQPAFFGWKYFVLRYIEYALDHNPKIINVLFDELTKLRTSVLYIGNEYIRALTKAITKKNKAVIEKLLKILVFDNFAREEREVYRDLIRLVPRQFEDMVRSKYDEYMHPREESD